MAIGKSRLIWTIIISLLISVIVVSGVFIWMRYPRNQSIEITLSNPEKIEGQIFVSGAVPNPSIYPLKTSDSIENIIQASGGFKTDADYTSLRLYIPSKEELYQPQKVDINRADIWLLKALPGIGDTRAQAIVNYRNKNGSFRYITELTKVEGINVAIYENIKELITVSD